MEQLVARQAHNLEVACSSPASATIKCLKLKSFKHFFCFFICGIENKVETKRNEGSVEISAQ